MVPVIYCVRAQEDDARGARSRTSHYNSTVSIYYSIVLLVLVIQCVLVVLVYNCISMNQY